MDRYISVYLMNYLIRFLGTKSSKTTSILMYHSVSDKSSSASHPYFETNTIPERFQEQIQGLRKAGFRSVPLDQISKDNYHGKTVAITFDDGYKDFFTTAWPILRENHFTASVFLVTDYIGSSFLGRPCLSWNEVQQAKREGVVFGSHSASHLKLAEQSDLEVERQWITSKALIEEKLNEKTNLFSYPYAFPEANTVFVNKLRHILSASGYSSGVTTIVGNAKRNEDTFFLPRIPVNSFDDKRLFSAKLEGAYDWLHSVQVLSKYRERFARTSRLAFGGLRQQASPKQDR